ncbi:hypothetical protein RB195_013865 [Necator americanus]|uniref:Uncharacterized protein n=1 Tax=Necator americanus TaxID=51031 RepID=A0ABR1DXH5_NECAM
MDIIPRRFVFEREDNQTTIQFLSVFPQVGDAAKRLAVFRPSLRVATDSRKKGKHRDRDRDKEEPKDSPPKEAPAQPTTAPEPVGAVSTAHEMDETSPEEMYKCRDYTPAIFNDLQPLFDLLKKF